MKIRNLLLAGLVPVLAWSCSDDKLQGGENTPPSTASQNYMEVSIKMPITTRTASPSTETEDGQDYENSVKEVLVVVVNVKDKEQQEDTYYVKEEGEICFVKSVGIAQSPDKTTEGVHGNDKSYIARINNVTLDTNSDKYYAVYAFVNPTPEIYNYYNGKLTQTGWKDQSEMATAETVTGFITKYADKAKGRFFMTDTNVGTGNYSGPDRRQAVHFVAEEGNYKLAATAKVERAVARFDYKAANDENEYEIKDRNTNATQLTVTLEGYKLMNVSKSFYHLKRVAAKKEGDSTDPDETKITYGGAETVNNYVVDCDWNSTNGKKTWLSKITEGGKESSEALAIRKGLFFTPLANSEIDKEENNEPYLPLDFKEPENTADPAYYIMGYCTENTVPSVASQQNGLSTAVVFKAKVSGDFINEASTAALYEYNGSFYNHWDSFKEAWNISGNTSLEAVNEPTTSEELKTLRETLNGKAKRIPIQGVDGNKYGNVYYIYWNRHNDNGQNTNMGIMEFAVVRNNIYKLSVSKISELGHPNDPTNPTDPQEPDPDPVNPPKPDEQNKAYMEVDVQILDWTVRVNDIEF